MLSPAEYYIEQKEQYGQSLAKTSKDINTVSMLRLLFALCTLVAGICAIHYGQGWQWGLSAALVAAFLALVRRHHQLSDRRDTLQLHLSILDNELKALEGNISSFPDGNSYVSIAHPYSYDLDIFGKGSINQALCRTVTEGGKALLARRLSSLALNKEVVQQRQGIIKELSSMPEFLQNFRVAAAGLKEDAGDQARLTTWLNGEDFFLNNQAARIAAVVMPVLSAACIIWSVILGGLSSWFMPVIIVNWSLLGIFQKKIKVAGQQMGNIAPLIDKYELLLQQVAANGFTLDWLKQVNIRAGSTLADITQFKKSVHLFDSRSNGMTGPLMNTFFLFDFYCLIKLESWRKKNRQEILAAMEAIIEMDTYVSCSVYAFNNPSSVYPEIATSGSEIGATNLRHPLLPARSAIGNDVSLGRQEQFYLLTGANMTGKSTFIRTIGVSIVLANLGLPLPANEVSLPLQELYTSMRITDSVQEDISYFRAELNRIRNIMDKVRSSSLPCLVLLDEPLRGTNSTDKQQGTRSIVETLLTCKATGIVATHDTGLCDMQAHHPGKVTNYNFESKVEKGGLSFDFKLKSGCSTSNNATILMRQMGIINE